MSVQKQKIGNFGQKMAKDYLVRHKYVIIGEHYVIRGGEIDLIAKIGQEIVFVEVKTRTSKVFGRPEDAVNSYKLQAMRRTAEHYLYTYKLIGVYAFRFDIIGVLVSAKHKKVTITHLSDILVE